MRLSLVVLLCFTIVLVNSATTRRRLIVTSGRNTTKAPAPKSAYAYLRTVRGKKSCSGGTCPFWERHGRSFAALRCYSQQYQECTCLHRMCFSSCMFSREVCNQEMVSCLRQICPRCMPPSASAMCAVYDSMATRVAEALSVFACYPCCAIFHAAPTNTTNTASSTTTPAITESSTTVPFEETYETFGPSNTENPEDDYYTGIINQLSTNAVPFNNQNAGSYPTNNVNNGVYTNSNGNIYPNTNVNGNTNINSFPNTNVNTNSNINGNGVPNTNTNTFINANGNGVPNTNTNTFPNTNNNGYANGNTNVNAPINTNANGNGVPNTNANGNGVPNTNANGNGVSNTNVNTLPNTNANANPNANTNTNSNGNGNAGANVNSATTGNGINNVNNGNGNGYSGNCNGVNNYPGVVFPGSDAMFYNNNFPLRNQQAVKQRGRQTAMPGKRRSTTRRTLATTRRPAQANRIVRGSTVKSSVRKPVQAVKKPQTNNRVKS
ncbi:hypothetical protein I4U23_029159 [Adineta vaga]|nr:hypothetical protein I4U23_029159 [Adineta vaga]